MEFGTRSIRSSGRGSGSIEITLPSRLRALSGLSCRITWHDAPVPHIRLAPDLRAARLALDRLWDLLLHALALPPAPPPRDIRLGAHAATALRWDDVLAVSEPGLHDAAAASRVLATLAGQARPAPDGFAASLAFLATGAVPGPEYQADCAIAAAAFTPRAAAPLDVFGDALWQAVARQAPPLLGLHQALAADPRRHQALRGAASAGAALDLQDLLP